MGPIPKPTTSLLSQPPFLYRSLHHHLLRLAEFPGWVEGLLGAGLGAQGSTSARIRTVLCKRLISGVVGESVGSTLRLCCWATSLPTAAQPLTSCAPWGHYAASLCLFPICETGS